MEETRYLSWQLPEREKAYGRSQPHGGFHRKSTEAQCVSEHTQGKTST